ncbi:hypothetical protein [Undibacterium terreum]|uniref:Uncharacterized protein n=1 Tax=Undibacterium terreum TaxID=1224302 RepID=A0A916U7C8_9BURK|nr:hypothetical protein [Undibacterium terreum]GGC63344.1 hypothetical protein GCM10011396_07860 [Undibacterium terreum]
MLKRDYSPDTLPKRNLPLVSIIDQLKQQAAEGNYRAACRLAAELMRCTQVIPEIQRALEERRTVDLKNAKQAGDTERIESIQGAIADMEIGMARDKQICAGFENKENLEIWRYKLQAAQSGHAPSILDFVDSPTWLLTDQKTYEDAWITYRDNGEALLSELARSGNKRAIIELIMQYVRFDTQTAAIIGKYAPFKPDQQKAAMYIYAYYLLPNGNRSNAPFLNEALRKISQQLTSDQLAAAKSQADQLAASWPADQALQRNPPRMVHEAGDLGLDDICSQ